MSGCAFCRSRKLPSWSTHHADQCVVLAKHPCTYCKGIGHTNSRCPISMLNKQKQERKMQEDAEKSKLKATGWAAIAAKNITEQDSKKIEEANRKVKEEAEARAIRFAEKERIRREESRAARELKFPRIYAMVKTPLTIPATHSRPAMYIPKGEFWYFRIEGTRDDNEHARALRDKNRDWFLAYLKEKYWDEWMREHEDDCVFLCDLREKEEDQYYNQPLEIESQWEIEYKHRREQERQEKAKMKSRLKRGLITQDDYDLWKMEKQEEEMEDDYAYEMESTQLYEIEYRQNLIAAREKSEWLKRKALRKQQPH